VGVVRYGLIKDLKDLKDLKDKSFLDEAPSGLHRYMRG
jgi:hypothetical protein